MGDSSAAAYVRMVQYLIEKCLVFHMDRLECADALFKHANIQPVITTTVWKELEKENRDFFNTYFTSMEQDGRVVDVDDTDCS